MSGSRKPSRQVSFDERVRVVLGVSAGEMSMAEAARRLGGAYQTVSQWRDRFVEAGKAGLESKLSGPRSERTVERRLRAENEQLVQLRLWQEGAEHVDEVPSQTSKP